MLCNNISECFEQISAYYNGEKTGHFLLVNAENFDDYQAVLCRLQADSSKKSLYVSDNLLPKGLPDIDSFISLGVGNGDFVLVGISQALMLKGEKSLEETVGEILGRPISGHAVVLLNHCQKLIEKFISRDLRVNNRVVLFKGESLGLPKIKIAKNADTCLSDNPLKSFGELLKHLEKITDSQISAENPITLISNLPISIFSNSILQVNEAEGVYEVISKKYLDIDGATDKSYGTDVQWTWLLEQMKICNNFSELVCSKFGSTTNLNLCIAEVMSSNDKNLQWLLWLALKIFGVSNNEYLTVVISESKTCDDFEEHLYLDLSEVSVNDPRFDDMFVERKRLLSQLPEKLHLAKKYCDKVGIHQKNEVFYLTDSSDVERVEFLRCLNQYDYSKTEFEEAIKHMSMSLYKYIGAFEFNEGNTKLSNSDSNLWRELTDYFNEYRIQKLTNKISPKFLETVNNYAVSRPYNKLQPRSSIISHIDKSDTKLFFFDALGVEYLPFVLAQCEKYGMIAEVSIGHCELPSITLKNTEFFQYFSKDQYSKIDELDKMKHHSIKYDYQLSEYPLHIFEELEVIDKELKKIQASLIQEEIGKALLASDHGASRLAVIYGQESNKTVVIYDESGEHSGRCCLSEDNPNIQFAAYEDGYSILANYERFKGGRKANVEVHGGASLEEVLVPVIVLTKKPENLEVCFVNSTVKLIPRSEPEITLYSNMTLNKPRLLVNGEFYEGECVSDKKYFKFTLSKIKRKGKYKAEVYDEDKNLSITLDFSIQKQTREKELF